jgi:hypothetical protein
MDGRDTTEAVIFSPWLVCFSHSSEMLPLPPRWPERFRAQVGGVEITNLHYTGDKSAKELLVDQYRYWQYIFNGTQLRKKFDNFESVLDELILKASMAKSSPVEQRLNLEIINDVFFRKNVVPKWKSFVDCYCIPSITIYVHEGHVVVDVKKIKYSWSKANRGFCRLDRMFPNSRLMKVTFQVNEADSESIFQDKTTVQFLPNVSYAERLLEYYISREKEILRELDPKVYLAGIHNWGPTSSKLSYINRSMALQYFRTLCANNLDFLGRSYKMLAFSSGGLRKRSAFFFAESGNDLRHISISDVYKLFGLSISGKMPISKLSLRVNILLSPTMAVDNMPVTTYRDRDVTTNSGKNNWTNGCGRMSKKVAERILSFLERYEFCSRRDAQLENHDDLDYEIETPVIGRKQRRGWLEDSLSMVGPPSAAQIRFSDVKGMVVWDETENIFDIVTRDEMHKLPNLASDSPYHDIIEIIGFSEPSPRVRLTPQLISGLLVCAINKTEMKFSIKGMLNEWLTILQETFTNPESFYQSAKVANDWNAVESFLYGSLPCAFLSSRALNEVFTASVPVKLSRVVYGVSDPLALLKPGEVYFSYSCLDQNGEVLQQIHEGKLLVCKEDPPALFPSDLLVLEAVKIDALTHLRDVIVFSCSPPGNCSADIKPDFEKSSGADLDGDKFWVIWEEALLKNMQQRRLFEVEEMSDNAVLSSEAENRQESKPDENSYSEISGLVSKEFFDTAFKPCKNLQIVRNRFESLVARNDELDWTDVDSGNIMKVGRYAVEMIDNLKHSEINPVEIWSLFGNYKWTYPFYMQASYSRQNLFHSGSLAEELHKESCKWIKEKVTEAFQISEDLDTLSYFDSCVSLAKRIRLYFDQNVDKRSFAVAMKYIDVLLYRAGGFLTYSQIMFLFSSFKTMMKYVMFKRAAINALRSTSADSPRYCFIFLFIPLLPELLSEDQCNNATKCKDRWEMLDRLKENTKNIPCLLCSPTSFRTMRTYRLLTEKALHLNRDGIEIEKDTAVICPVDFQFAFRVKVATEIALDKYVYFNLVQMEFNDFFNAILSAEKRSPQPL